MALPFPPGGTITLTEEQFATMMSTMRASASLGAETASNISNSVSSSRSVPDRDDILILQPKGEVGRSGVNNRTGYSLQDASRLSPARYKMLYITVTVHLYKHCDVSRTFSKQDPLHLTAVRVAVKKVHRWLWRYPKLWIIDKMMIQLLTTSARENNFEDWGEENLLLAVERGVQYVEDPPGWNPKRPKASEDGVSVGGPLAEDAPVEAPGDVAEGGGGSKQSKQGGGRGKRQPKPKPKKLPKQAAQLAVEEEDSSDVESGIGSTLAQRRPPAKAQRKRGMAPKLASKGKGKEVAKNIKSIQLSDPDDDPPFSTHEAGSSDESEDSEEEDEVERTTGSGHKQSLPPAPAPAIEPLPIIAQPSLAPAPTSIPEALNTEETTGKTKGSILSTLEDANSPPLEVTVPLAAAASTTRKAPAKVTKPKAPPKAHTVMKGTTAKRGREDLGVVEESIAKRTRGAIPPRK